MRKAKPVAMVKKNLTKAEKAAREAGEIAFKAGEIRDYTPLTLSERGREIYDQIVDTLPDDLLSLTDGYTIEIVADSIDMMHDCRELIQRQGIIVKYTNTRGVSNAEQNKAILAYQKYSDIFKKHVTELGLTPSARAKIASMAAEGANKKPTLDDMLEEDD